jgi:lysyl-tRNA synthetase class 1
MDGMNLMTSGSERDLAFAARAWPFEEARKLIERIGGTVPE